MHVMLFCLPCYMGELQCFFIYVFFQYFIYHSDYEDIQVFVKCTELFSHVLLCWIGIAYVIPFLWSLNNPLSYFLPHPHFFLPLSPLSFLVSLLDDIEWLMFSISMNSVYCAVAQIP